MGIGRWDQGYTGPQTKWEGRELRVRAGSHQNRSGMAEIRVSLVSLPGEGIFLQPEGPDRRAAQGCVPGSAVPAEYQAAILRGAREALAESGDTRGWCLELHEALVHPADATAGRFREAGYEAVRRWIDAGL